MLNCNSRTFGVFFLFTQLEVYTSSTAQYGGCEATEIRADYYLAT